MASNETELLARLVDDARNGNANSRDELVKHSYRRLRFLAKRILRKSFPDIGRIHETDSVLHEALVKLLQALRSIPVDSLQHYLRLAARIIRHTLFDLARAGRVRNHLSIDQMMMRASDGVAHYQAVANTGNPDDRIQRIEAFEELQQTIENLPDDERNVVDLHLVQGLSQADIAAMLQEHPKKISRLWRSAKCKLPEWLF